MDKEEFERRIQSFIQEAKAAGYSDEEIQRRVMARRVEFQAQQAQQIIKTPETKAPEKRDLGILKTPIEWAPVIGAIGGEYIGGPVGAAIGGGGGEVIREIATGEELNLGEIALQAGLAGFGGKFAEIGGRILGAPFKPILGAARKAAEPVVEAAGEIASPALRKGTNIAAKVLASAFNIPRKFVQELKPVETAQEILQYDLKATSREGLQKVVGQVTGQSGIMSKIVREAIGRIRGNVDISNVPTVVSDLLDQSTLEKDVLKDVNLRILRIITPTSEGESIGLGELRPLDALDKVRQLETIGYNFLRAAKRSVLDPTKYEEQGRVFLGAADEIMQALVEKASQEGTLEMFKTPEIISQIQKISSRLAEQFMGANTLRDLRAIQAPFVRLGRILNLTGEAEAGATSAFTRMIGSRLIGGAAGAIAGTPLGPLGTIAGTAVGVTAEPVVESIIETTRFPAISLLAKGIKGFEDLFIRGRGAQIIEEGARQAIRTGKATPSAINAASNFVKGLTANFLSQMAPRMALNTVIPDTSMLGTPEATANTQQVAELESRVNKDTNNGLQFNAAQAAIAMLAYPKYANIIKSVYQILNPDAQKKTLSVQAAQIKNNAEMGVKSVDRLEELIKKDPGVLLKAQLPGSPGAREFVMVRTSLIQNLRNVMTGKQFSQKEMEEYEKELPTAFDSGETIKAKLDWWRNFFNSMVQGIEETRGAIEFPSSPAEVTFPTSE